MSASASSVWNRRRHLRTFVIAGALAFLIDAGVFVVLTRGAKLDPLAGRIFAISAAMLVSWLLNRTFTFRVSEPPSWREFLRFTAMAITVAALNYAIFAVLLMIAKMTPIAALIVSAIAAACFAYYCMRYAVFAVGVGTTRPR
jgi:putative flippase GtrA